jgi:hypothetical protein
MFILKVESDAIIHSTGIISEFGGLASWRLRIDEPMAEGSDVQTASVVSLLQQSEFYLLAFPTQPANQSFKEPHRRTRPQRSNAKFILCLKSEVFFRSSIKSQTRPGKESGSDKKVRLD